MPDTKIDSPLDIETESLAHRIWRLRMAAGLNKTQLARRVGVSDVTVGYWEAGTIKQIGHE